MLETWVFSDLLLTFKVRGKTSEAYFSLLSGKKWACYCHSSTHYVVRPVWTVTKKDFLNLNIRYRSSRPEVFCKKHVHKNFPKFTEKLLCQSLFFSFIKKEALVQVLSSEFCEILRNTSGDCFCREIQNA